MSQASSDDDSEETVLPILTSVSWFRQFTCVTIKNWKLLTRRPITLCFMLISSALSVAFAWVAGRDPEDAIYPPLSDCGTVPIDFAQIQNLTWREQDRIQYSLNDRWRWGLPISLMVLGPCFNAVLVFNILHSTEFAPQMLGVQRALGLRDSVFWSSWYSSFAVIAFVNAILGALTAKVMPGIHAYDAIYFGGIFFSLWLLQLSLTAASCFLAALCGTAKRGPNWIILIMLICMWIPTLVNSGASSWEESGNSPSGVFWQNWNTYQQSYRRYTYNYTINETHSEFRWEYESTECNRPLVSDFQGHFYKTEAQQQAVRDDEIFAGCFTLASWPVDIWNPRGRTQKIGLPILFFFPYFHFLTVWGNFLGYTSMPKRKFTAKEVGMSPEALAVKALPTPPDPSRGLGTTLVPQGSMIQVDRYWEWRPCYGEVCEQLKTCPDGNRTEDFCEYLNDCDHVVNDKPTESPTTRHGYFLLLASSVFYMIVAAYWAQVFPGGNGKPLRCLFFLRPSYWFASTSVSKRRNVVAGDEENSPVSAQRASTTGGGSIVVDSVRKVYGSEEALKGVSLNMDVGEVTALLGHNGAGKTTLSHVLCCEIVPTEGDIYVFGHSVTENPYAVRRMVGLCKQDDYLWPDLTAREHLELFAGLRGVYPPDLDDTVQKWLESVDLVDVQSQYSSTFSGGMKRRLSVALATIGDRPLIILDEPTTGMDPVSRRFVWRHIDSIKDGRVVLLTTHAMEEADLLADEVAILRKGELAAFGSPLSLKADHGSALQFSVLIDKATVAKTNQRIVDFFKDSSDWVRVDSGEAGNVSVNIERICSGEESDGVPVKILSDFVAWLESDESPVKEYGFSNSSLEEVFMKVTGEGKEDSSNGDSSKVKQRCCSCCCCFGSAHRSREDSGTEDESGGDVEPLGKLGAEELAAFQPNLNVLSQTRALFFQFSARSWTGRGSIVGYLFHGIFLAATILVGIAYANAWNPVNIFAVPTVAMSVLLVTVIAPMYADRADGVFYLMRSQGLMESSYLLSSVIYSFAVALVYNLMVIGGIYATPIFRPPEECGVDDDDYCDRRFGDRQKYDEAAAIYWEDMYMGSPVEISAVRSPSGFGMVFGVAVVSALTIPGATLASSYLPGYRLPMVFVALAAIMFSSWPVIQTIVPQSEEQYIACLNTTNPDNVCDTFFSLSNADQHFLNCVGLYVNGDSSRSFCIQPSAGLLPQFGIFQSLSMAYMSDIRFISDPPEYIEEKLIPSILALGGTCEGDTCQFPYAIKLYALNLVFMLIGSMMLLIIGVLLAAVVGFPSGFILEVREGMSAAIGHLRHPSTGRRQQAQAQLNSSDSDKAKELEEVGRERRLVHEMMASFTSGSASRGELSLNHAAIPRHQVPPVVMHSLQKVYPGLGGRPPKIALNSLDLHVPKGQVLGFLGKNGAGKTTALKILAGAHEPSGGYGLVAGYDCALERNTVFESLGNCAQFDVVWAGQSVQHHLEFFIRLKGLPSSMVKDTARSIATAVGLGSPSVYQRKAGQLSGGMRRRLSIALSLIGSPSVLILDEPTTGLDPSTRNQIWKLINSFAKADRSTIITTHMMIEADTLCNRIAIISQGELKVVGTQQHLKNKFGSGYLLQLNLVKSSTHAQQCAMEFVKRRLHPDAILGIRQAKTLHIHLPRDKNLDLQRVFAALYSPECSTEGCVNQFLLSQSSLEDVFVELGD